MKVGVGIATIALAAALLSVTPAGAQQDGSISGTVTAEGGGPLSGICVAVTDIFEEVTATTSASGTYTVSGLFPGEYLVHFNGCQDVRNTQYADEWWQESPGFSDAKLVTVGEGQTVTGINGTLPLAGHITGTLTDATTSQGLAGICINAVDVDQLSFATAESSGTGAFDLSVRAGTYVIIFFDCTIQKTYIPEIYNDIMLPEDGEPTPVAVAAGQTTAGINASLEQGGTIAGNVIASHTGAPLDGACVVALDPSTGEELWFATTGEEGAASGGYQLGGLPAGTYKVEFVGECSPKNHATETRTQTVTVEVGKITSGIDAALPPVADLSAACPEDQIPSAFTDTGGSVHELAIDCVAWWEVARGTGGDRYSPAGLVRRDQMASFIARLLDASGVTLPSNPPDRFSDDEGNAHELAINQLAALGVVGGTGPSRYSPGGLVRRDQMATFLVNAYQKATSLTLKSAADGPVDHFTDDQSSAHQANINKAAEAAFTSGVTATTYNPTGAVRRDQMASFLARVLDRLVWEGFV